MPDKKQRQDEIIITGVVADSKTTQRKRDGADMAIVTIEKKGVSIKAVWTESRFTPRKGETVTVFGDLGQDSRSKVPMIWARNIAQDNPDTGWGEKEASEQSKDMWDRENPQARPLPRSRPSPSPVRETPPANNYSEPETDDDFDDEPPF